MVGRFTMAFNYSGPSASIVHVETQARNGKNAYVDADAPFARLPAESGRRGLGAGGEAATACTTPSISWRLLVAGATVVGSPTTTGCRGRRGSRAVPADTGRSWSSLGQPMTMFRRAVEQDESLTLGANTESQAPRGPRTCTSSSLRRPRHGSRCVGGRSPYLNCSRDNGAIRPAHQSVTSSPIGPSTPAVMNIGA